MTMDDNQLDGAAVSRRTLFKAMAGGMATVGTMASASVSANSGRFGRRFSIRTIGNPYQRAADVFRNTLARARGYLTAEKFDQEVNGDEGRYPDLRCVFGKTLPHNELGLPDPVSYRALVRALAGRDPAGFAAIPLDETVRTRGLANPQAAFVLPSVGPDGPASRMAPAPTFAGQTTAAEMLEVYWKALLRDVPFRRFATSPAVGAALDDLNAFPETVGAPASGRHTIDTVFRGETPGDRTGPYISQFLYRDIPYGASVHAQVYRSLPPGNDFGTTFEEWLTIQRGGVPRTGAGVPPRYIHDGRSLSEYVHADFPAQPYLNAALILLGLGPAFLAPEVRATQSATEEAFVTFGIVDVLDTVTKVTQCALAAAWFQKWSVHRRLRPEAYAGRAEVQAHRGYDMGLPSNVFESEAARRLLAAHGNLLLPLAYPEGSPTHPAYPAGHACIAGASATILKAYFDEDAILPDAVEANDTGSALLPVAATLTVGGEIDKLANNISLGRDWAGVHYRSDGTDGLAVGEEVALALLKDQSSLYNEGFAGFTLTRFNGQRVRIANGVIA